MKQIDTIILVKDITAIKNFYISHLQLEILHDWESMVIFKNRLAFHQHDLLRPQEIISKYVYQSSNSNVIIYIATDDLDEIFNRLKMTDISFIHDIIELPWQKIFRIKDIEGNIIEIGEEIQ